MIKKKLLKGLPVEFQKMDISEKKTAKKDKGVISIEILQTNASEPDNFYRPISKYLHLNDE